MTELTPSVLDDLADRFDGGGWPLNIDALDADPVREALTDAGWSVRVVDGATINSKTEAIAAVRTALNLPASVLNLDALADALGDLGRFNEARDVALVWGDAQVMVNQAPQVWSEITNAIFRARMQLWDGGTDPLDRALDFIAVFDEREQESR